MAEGFFHADPHPGNMKWWNDKIYLIDLGMVGELSPEVRELLMLLVLAFAQEDPDFLAEAVLLLSGDGERASEVPMESFRVALRGADLEVPGALAEGDPARAAAPGGRADRGPAQHPDPGRR